MDDHAPTRSAGDFSRREFLAASTLAVAGFAAGAGAAGREPIIDIHQHRGYAGRADDALVAHQRAMGATMTILLPAGRSVNTPSTHGGESNGLEAQCLGTASCREFAAAHRKEFAFAANDVPDIDGAVEEIQRYLKLGAVAIAEQKFGVECDSPEMQKIYQVAQDRGVPVLMHWQFQRYNYGFERFYTMLDKYPKVISSATPRPGGQTSIGTTPISPCCIRRVR